MKTAIVVAGTRPETIKIPYYCKSVAEKQNPLKLFHFGQHYDYNMAQQFIEGLELPQTDYTFTINVYSLGTQTARIMMFMDKFLSV
ncbi:MAG: UDP-N-acetylglucosamine 2-epimerase [Candidatus Bathyarchaeota archaeon]|nr:MAG: UDP-N-acetylglucosamine 2-epimerase [Candidatus Bathyarchaeota archaeon]